MKKLLLLLVICFPISAFAQLSDNNVEQLMTHRILSCDEITYNAVSMIPNLYKEHKTDTLEALLGYWRRNCGMSEPVVTFTILYEIEQGTFKEQIKLNKAEYAVDSREVPNTDYYATNMISYLHWYQLGSDIRNHPKAYSPDNDADYIVAAFGAYYDFLRVLAEQLCNKPGLTPVESYLVHYYAQPNTAPVSKLSDAAYSGTVLQHEYLTGLDKQHSLTGLSIGGTAGMWYPNGNLSILGPHPYLGFIIGGRYKKFMFDFNATMRMLRSANYYKVENTDNDSVYLTKDYQGYYLGADCGYSLIKTKKQEVDILAGIGWEGIDVTIADSVYNTYPSLNVNAGLGYKVYIGSRDTKKASVSWYISAQAKYNFTGFNNKGGTDLAGGAFTFGIVCGCYRTAHNYYFLPPGKNNFAPPTY